MPKPIINVARVFNDSLKHCVAHPAFFKRFHERFLSSSDEVRKKFKNTDCDRQIRVLKASFYYVLLASRGDRAARAQLAPVAERHSRKGLNIQPRLYGLWLDCLVEVVKECDPGFSTEVEYAWRKTMGWGIKSMMLQY